MHFREIYKRLLIKSSLCFQFHEEDHAIALKERALILANYLEIRGHRIYNKKCDNCCDRTARDDFWAEVENIAGYNDEKCEEFNFCSEGCRDDFEQDYGWCECGKLYERADMASIDSQYLCKTCATDHAIQNELTVDMFIEHWEFWLEGFIRDASSEDWVKRELKSSYKKIGWNNEWEKIEEAFYYVKALNPLIVPTKGGWNFYIKKDYDADLEADIRATNVYLLIKNINNKTHKHA